MRNAFADHMIELGQDKKNIFLTGDLGFMALEGVREAFGKRFINCGVSEQNMIGVAAGLAKSDYCVFAYSIAPFIYARPFEQIRNDIALSNLSVAVFGYFIYLIIPIYTKFLKTFWWYLIFGCSLVSWHVFHFNV